MPCGRKIGSQDCCSVVQGDALELMRALPDSGVDLIVADPPYFRVKNEPWDRQWESAEGFLAWLGTICEQWQRILKPNGSLYCFASPMMAAKVECKIGERLNPLNRIRWNKKAGWHNKVAPQDLRSYLSPWEEIIFAEQFGADNMAKGEAGYVAKCDELRGFVFEPLRAYLDGERAAAGFDRKSCDEACGNQMSGHYFSRIQWTLPTAENYTRLRLAFNRGGCEFLRREYEDLRREYEDLRREYEDLRRPFFLTADVPYTDVWDFPTVNHYPGKHPCEKPLEMIKHIISASSRPGAIMLDPFLGGGTSAVAAAACGRHFLGFDLSAEYCRKARERIARVEVQPRLFESESK